MVWRRAGESDDKFLVDSDDSNDEYLYETIRNDLMQATGFLCTIVISHFCCLRVSGEIQHLFYTSVA